MQSQRPADSRKSIIVNSKSVLTATIPDSTGSPKTPSPSGGVSMKPQTQSNRETPIMLRPSPSTVMEKAELSEPLSTAAYMVPKTPQLISEFLRTTRTRRFDSAHPRNSKAISLADMLGCKLSVPPSFKVLTERIKGGMMRRMKSNPKTTDEYMNFQNALRTVLQVSKTELRQREASYKAANEGKPKRGPKPKASLRATLQTGRVRKSFLPPCQ